MKILATYEFADRRERKRTTARQTVRRAAQNPQTREAQQSPGHGVPAQPAAGLTDPAVTAKPPLERGSAAGATLPDSKGSGGPDPAPGRATCTHQALWGPRRVPSLQEGDAASENRDRPRGGQPRPRCPSPLSPGACAGRGSSSRKDVSRSGRPQAHSRLRGTGGGRRADRASAA